MNFKQIASIILLAVTAGTAFGGDTPRQPVTEYELLRRIPAERLRALIGDTRPDAQGFIGTNHRAGQWIEAGTQRGSCRVVIYGVVTGDLAAADDAWRGIEVTFAHQRADGGFEANDRPNGASAKPFGAAVETAFFFLQELGRAILVIRESPHEKHFHNRLVALEPKLRRAMAFVAAGYDTIIANSTHAVNRIVIAAKAFGLCGLALHDDQLVATARKLIAHALTRRDQEGVFIEKDGRDSSYNAVSILFGQTLALHLPIPEFEAALPKAVAWQLTCIRPNGEVDVTGNTRTGVGKEKSIFGEPKNVNYGEIVQALTMYGLVNNDKTALATADRVFAFWRAGVASAK
ncbi:MAG: hypothetical protein HY011_29680 [Acidobacteria bacterium]|nr:hypothetical protein [Acidobacteriota bacterium]